MFRKLREKFFGYAPTEQEQQLIDIVTKLLNHPKTSLRMTPLSNRYFLLNEKKHYYVLLKDQGIQLTNSHFSFTKSLSPKSNEIIIDNINNHIETDRQLLEERLFKNETQILNSVLTKLDTL